MRYSMAILLALATVVTPANNSFAQRAGQSVTVRTGTVTAMKSVDLNDGNALKGAVVGGAFGAALTRSSKSSGRRDKNAAVGALIGGAAAASQTRPGRIYTVTTNEGTIIQIATEQTEMRIDDCVYVEEAGGTSNIRRAPAAACSPGSQAVLREPAVAKELEGEASACMVAKEELVNAESDAAVERAVTKIQILCYD